MDYKKFFVEFFRVGLFTLGGGYAMIPIIEDVVVRKHKWIDEETFIDLVALAQSCPGVFAVNLSTYVGYKVGKTPCALCCALGTALPSFFIILAIALFFRNFQDIGWVASTFAGIRPAVVALIAVPTFNMARTAKINIVNGWIPIVSALLIWLLEVNAIYVLLVAAVAGYIYGKFIKPTE